MRPIIALLCLALAGCGTTPTQPLVDMTDINPVRFQRDIDYCQSIGTNYDAAGPIVVGAIMGATLGVGAAAFGAGALASTTAAEGYGAAAGAVAGGGAAAAVNEGAVTLPEGVPTERMSVADCLRARGYKVLVTDRAAK